MFPVRDRWQNRRMLTCSAWKVSGVKGKGNRADASLRFDLHDMESEAGAEFLIVDGDLAFFDIAETETSIIGYRKREKNTGL